MDENVSPIMLNGFGLYQDQNIKF